MAAAHGVHSFAWKLVLLLMPDALTLHGAGWHVMRQGYGSAASGAWKAIKCTKIIVCVTSSV
jgi:hypothetical protein